MRFDRRGLLAEERGSLLLAEERRPLLLAQERRSGRLLEEAEERGSLLPAQERGSVGAGRLLIPGLAGLLMLIIGRVMFLLRGTLTLSGRGMIGRDVRGIRVRVEFCIVER